MLEIFGSIALKFGGFALVRFRALDRIVWEIFMEFEPFEDWFLLGFCAIMIYMLRLFTDMADAGIGFRTLDLELRESWFKFSMDVDELQNLGLESMKALV